MRNIRLLASDQEIEVMQVQKVISAFIMGTSIKINETIFRYAHLKLDNNILNIYLEEVN